jgi:7-keto-8-aminopelargonate synthetase-like enzyme
MQTADDVNYTGRHVQVRGQELRDFGSCSYLGLEQRPEVKRGAIEAIERFGTQFAFSRVYLQLPLYPELEAAITSITGGHVLVAPSTTLAHIAALPTLIGDEDAVIIDQFAHASLQMATALLRSVPVESVKHNRMDLLEHAIVRLSKTHRRVWYVLDGLYSMLGDFAPIDRIAELLAKYPQFHAYIDDAHSTSWIGERGRGYALDHLPDRSRVIVALTLSKAFSAGGAVLVFANAEDRVRVRHCGGPMLFSGPLQPALLGAALASAKLHLQPEFAELQRGLARRIDRAHELARDLGVPFAATDRTPIIFIRCGASSVTIALAQALSHAGFNACISVFPAVPLNQGGVRLTISMHNTLEDIDDMMGVLSREMRRLSIASESGQFVVDRAAGPR